MLLIMVLFCQVTNCRIGACMTRHTVLVCFAKCNFPIYKIPNEPWIIFDWNTSSLAKKIGQHFFVKCKYVLDDFYEAQSSSGIFPNLSSSDFWNDCVTRRKKSSFWGMLCRRKWQSDKWWTKYTTEQSLIGSFYIVKHITNPRFPSWMTTKNTFLYPDDIFSRRLQLEQTASCGITVSAAVCTTTPFSSWACSWLCVACRATKNAIYQHFFKKPSLITWPWFRIGFVQFLPDDI